MRLTHCFWGGPFFPLIPIEDRAAAEKLIRHFAVDTLWAIPDTAEAKTFAASFSHLAWPLLDEDLLPFHGGKRQPAFLDVRHCILRLEEAALRKVLSPHVRVILPDWNKEDPLGDILLLTFGAFPDANSVGRDYGDIIMKRIHGERITLDPSSPIPLDLLQDHTPRTLASLDLRSHLPAPIRDDGIFCGNADDFDDLMLFWNLRASSFPICFYDSRHAARLGTLLDSHLAPIRGSTLSPDLPIPKPLHVWSTTRRSAPDLKASLGDHLNFKDASHAPWVDGNALAPVMGFGTSFTVASVTPEFDRPTATLALPRKPVVEEFGLEKQHLAISLSNSAMARHLEGEAFTPPFFPPLNEYYGRELHGLWNVVRSEPDSIAVIAAAGDSQVTLRALSHEKMIIRLFSAWGIEAKPSDAGLMCRRLIGQMGGLQGCRVFKIGGVRALIREYAPDKSFTRGTATKKIGNIDPANGKPRFADYEGLFIEQRTAAELTPNAVFDLLVKKALLRPGLELHCPVCELEGWVSVDDLRSQVTCQYCGSLFDVAVQLRDRDWRYRRSGLFGRSDEQKGAIPVVLTLQQLDTALSFPRRFYSTCLRLKGGKSATTNCEVDFVVIVGRPDGCPSMILGECKAEGPSKQSDKTRWLDQIKNDFSNLSELADHIESFGLRSYVLFSKTTQFSKEEIEIAKRAQRGTQPRVILLSDRELEPYHITERLIDLPSNLRHVLSPEDLARLTAHLYFS